MEADAVYGHKQLPDSHEALASSADRRLDQPDPGAARALRAALLEPYLRDNFLGGTAPGVSMFRPVLWGVAAVFFILSGRAMLTSQSRHEERQRSNSGCHTGPKAIPKKVKSDVRLFASALLVFAVGDLGFRRMHLQTPRFITIKADRRYSGRVIVDAKEGRDCRLLSARLGYIT